MAELNSSPQPPAPRGEDRINPPSFSAAPLSPQAAQQVAPIAQPPVSAPVPAPAIASEPAAEGEKLHVHSSYIWLGGLKSILVVLIALGASCGSSLVALLAEGDLVPEDALVVSIIIGVAAVFSLAIAAIVFLCTWWSWRHLFYQITPDEFTLYSGIFSKKQVHVPYQRIQSVDQRATLVQRVLGLCTVQIETAGGSTNKAVVVPYVTKDRAEWLRRELFARKQQLAASQSRPATVSSAAGAVAAGGVPSGTAPVPGTLGELLDAEGNVLDAPAALWNEVGSVFGGSAVETGRVSYEYGLTNKELLLTALSNNTAFVVVVMGLVAAVGQFVGEFLPLFFGSDDQFLDVIIDQSLRMFGGSIIAAAVFAFVVGAVVLWGLSSLSVLLSFGGFKARRRDSRIEVERGLLQHQFSGVDVDRVQSVVIRQSFIRRIMGYCELSLGKVDSVAGDNEKQSNLSDKGLVIHPFVKVSRVPEILSGLVPEFADVPTDAVAVAPVALRRAILRRAVWQGAGFWCAVVGCLVGFFAPGIAWALAEDAVEAESILPFLSIIAVVLVALGVVLFVLEVVSAILWARESSFAINRSFMRITNGGLYRESVTFPRKKIQFAYAKTNPFQRLARTATIVAVTAAGVGGTKVSLVDASCEAAAVWLSWAKPGGQGLSPAGFNAVKENKGSSQ